MKKCADTATSIVSAVPCSKSFPPRATRAMAPFLAQPGFLLARIDQICTAIHADLAEDDTLAQAEMLLLLKGLREPDQVSLASAAGVDSSTTALILNNLEARELVTRRHDPKDRRRRLVALTEAGRARMPAVRAAFCATQARLVEPLDPASIAMLVEGLRRIGSNPMSPAPLWVAPHDDAVAVVTESPGFLCRRVLQVSHAYFQMATGSLTLTLRQFSLLFLLSRQPEGLTQIGFARLFGLDPSTCALIMKNLLARKLLQRETSALDRRERVYHLTSAGREMLDAAQPCAVRSTQLVFRAIPGVERRRLVEWMQQLVRAHSGRLRFPGALFVKTSF